VKTGSKDSRKAIRGYLESLDKNDLVELLLERSARDAILRRALEIRAAASTKNTSKLEKAIDRALRSSTHVDHKRMPAYAKGAGEVIVQIQNVLVDGDPASAIHLTEFALRAVEHTLKSCYDLDRRMSEILGKLQAIHLEACEELQPEPESLAKRLFEWELETEWEVFYGATSTYAHVLGEQGLAEYRRLARALWAEMPQRNPGDNHSGESHWYRVTRIMTELAEAAGSLEELAEIQKKDLSNEFCYLRLAKIYEQMERRDLAIEWVRRGIEAFKGRPDGRLYHYLADLHEQDGDNDRSMEIEWAFFCKEPGFSLYPALEERAERLGQWEMWRPKAIQAIRQSISDRKSKHTSPYFRPDSTDLVRVYLYEDDAEAAWVEATQGGCSNDVFLQVVVKREALHPEESIPIYKKHIDNLVDEANTASYERAASYVERIRNLTLKAEYESYVASLRAKFKSKRNFMTLLDSLDSRV